MELKDFVTPVVNSNNKQQSFVIKKKVLKKQRLTIDNLLSLKVEVGGMI